MRTLSVVLSLSLMACGSDDPKPAPDDGAAAAGEGGGGEAAIAGEQSEGGAANEGAAGDEGPGVAGGEGGEDGEGEEQGEGAEDAAAGGDEGQVDEGAEGEGEAAPAGGDSGDEGDEGEGEGAQVEGEEGAEGEGEGAQAEGAEGEGEGEAAGNEGEEGQEGDEGGEGEGEGEGEGQQGDEGHEGDPVCEDEDLYADDDGDGYGVEPVVENQCIVDGEPPEGRATEAGDCRPNDPWANPGAQEICGDNVDDDCDGRDGACPESREAAMQISRYDCNGNPENFVLAYASFPDGDDYFADGGCFVVFEGAPGEFYVKHNLERANPECANSVAGCTCPTQPLGRTSWDRRLYALTLRGTPQACEDLELRDHGGEDQPVSNDCRKYLYQLHRYDIPFSFFAGGLEVARRRIDLFPTVELACLRDAPHISLPFRSLLRREWVYNPAYVPAD